MMFGDRDVMISEFDIAIKPCQDDNMIYIAILKIDIEKIVT